MKIEEIENGVKITMQEEDNEIEELEEDNTLSIKIELENIDEVIEKLEKVKKLLNEISHNEVHIDVNELIKNGKTYEDGNIKIMPDKDKVTIQTDKTATTYTTDFIHIAPKNDIKGINIPDAFKLDKDYVYCFKEVKDNLKFLKEMSEKEQSEFVDWIIEKINKKTR